MEQENNQHNNHATKYRVILIICVVLVVAGAALSIIFGIQLNNSNQHVAELEQQVDNQAKTIAQLQKSTANTETNATVKDTAQYIDVNAWGMKVKIPDDAKYLSYTFSINGNGNDDDTTLGVTAVDASATAMPDFAQTNNSTGQRQSKIGYLERVKSGVQRLTDCVLAFSKDGYDYYYYGPQARMTNDSSLYTLEQKSVELVKTMLSNPDNWSAL